MSNTKTTKNQALQINQYINIPFNLEAFFLIVMNALRVSSTYKLKSIKDEINSILSSRSKQDPSTTQTIENLREENKNLKTDLTVSTA